MIYTIPKSRTDYEQRKRVWDADEALGLEGRAKYKMSEEHHAAKGEALRAYEATNPEVNPFRVFRTEAEWQAHLDNDPGFKASYARGLAAGEAELAAKPYGPGHPAYERDFAQGAKEERERFAAIDASTMRGYEELAKEAKFGPNPMSAGEFALAQLKAEEKSRADHLQGMFEDAPKPAPTSFGSYAADARTANPQMSSSGNADQLANKIKDHQARAKAEGRTLTVTQALAEIEGRR